MQQKQDYMQKKYYITTPIYYVNDVPHIGHAYTTLACDVLARFHRLAGYDVKFLTGTDEHGQKVEKSAIAKDIDPQSFTDQVSKSFLNLGKVMNFSNDDFIRTTEPRHKKAAQALWNKLMENGEIYLGKYDGWYSVRDEAFYSESELVEGKAPTGAPVEWMEEPSYFFKLSKWQDKLLEFYEKNPDFIKPSSRRNEIISFVKSGLIDLSISRTSSKWGVPVPGNREHVMYVWLDALSNYISAIGYPDQKFKDYWPADVHVVGKDIIRFHAVYWPAFLMAAEIELPKTIMSHGWWTNEGEKISKSVGNVIDPIGLVSELGLDQTRWFLMREVIFGNDGDFSRDRMKMRINNELANKIGNLVQRTLSFVHKLPASSLGENINDSEIQGYITRSYNSDLLSLCVSSINQFKTYMLDQDISKYLDGIILITDEANTFIDREAPWLLKKTDLKKMVEVLYILLEAIRHLALYMQPIIPESAGRILEQLGVNDRTFDSIGIRGAMELSKVIPEPLPVFPRID